MLIMVFFTCATGCFLVKKYKETPEMCICFPAWERDKEKEEEP